MDGEAIQNFSDKSETNRNLLNEIVANSLQPSNSWLARIVHPPYVEEKFPVHLIVVHKTFDSIVINLLSSKLDVPCWSAYIEYSESCVAWIYTRRYFYPHDLIDVLQNLHELIISGYSTKDKLVTALRKQGAAL